MGAIDAADLRDRLAQLTATYGVPGASASVLAGEEVVDAAAGVVNLRTGVAVEPDSPFMIQSITKVWTATLVLQLVDDGLLDLDVPIRRYLPGFRTADARASAAITARHLLTHTGGFEGDLWGPTTSDRDALRLFVEEHVGRAPQHLEPGRLYSYCSAGMGVLGRLVEVSRGATYAEAFRRHLSDPLGLDGVAFDAGEALGFRTAIGHVSPTPGGPPRPLRTWAVMPESNPAAGNQLAMPARGLIALARLHLADGVTPEGVRLLSAESAQVMRTGQIEVVATRDRSARQGLGWQVTSHGRVVEHGGDAPGCGAMLKVVPDRHVAVAVLVNGGDMSGLVRRLCDDLLVELAGVEPTPPIEPPPYDPTAYDVTAYCGRYELRNETFTVAVDDRGRLMLTYEERDEAAAMADLAGIEPVRAVTELRRLDGERFLRVDADGRSAGVLEFIDVHAPGGARFLHAGRAAPRVPDPR